MKAILLAISIVLLVERPIGAVDLDAPAAPKPVTLRSEIERGFDAVNRLPMDPSSFRHLVDGLISQNKQRDRDTDGFKFGVYYQAWHRAWQRASVGMRDPNDQVMMEAAAKIFFLFTEVEGKTIGVDQGQIQAIAVSFVPEEQTVFRKVVETKRPLKGTYPIGEKKGPRPSTEIKPGEKK